MDNGNFPETDLLEVQRFFIYLRLLNQAIDAGVDRNEAAPIIYDDVYFVETT